MKETEILQLIATNMSNNTFENVSKYISSDCSCFSNSNKIASGKDPVIALFETRERVLERDNIACYAFPATVEKSNNAKIPVGINCVALIQPDKNSCMGFITVQLSIFGKIKSFSFNTATDVTLKISSPEGPCSMSVSKDAPDAIEYTKARDININDAPALNAALRKLRKTQSQDDFDVFTSTFKAAVDNGAWVNMPCKKEGGRYALKIVEERGKHFAVMFSDQSEARFYDGYDMLITDINNLLDPVFSNDDIDGIILDPFTTSLCLEKKYLLRCLLHSDYPNQNNSGSEIRDWGRGIPEYTDDDIMTPGEIQNFAIQSFLNCEESMQNYDIISACDFPGAMPSLILEKNRKYTFVYIKGYVSLEVPELSDEEKEKLKAIGKKYSAECFWAPVGFLSSDSERFVECLALRGDGFYCNYRGLIKVR